jgi:hypothetical protein
MSTSTAPRHPSRSPDVVNLLKVLERWEVDYILVGSVGAAVYGVDVQAGDLDVVPSTERHNLDRLIHVLTEIEGTPLGPFGEWRLLESGEWKWIARPTTEQELSEWRPDAGDLRTLDHLLSTRFGNLDVMPYIAGTYEALRPRALMRSWHASHVWVAHIDDLLARLTVPRREKDRDRVVALREVQRRNGAATAAP